MWISNNGGDLYRFHLRYEYYPIYHFNLKGEMMRPIIYMLKEVCKDENGKILGAHPDDNILGADEVVLLQLSEYNAGGWASGSIAFLVVRYQQTAQGDWPVEIDVMRTVNKTSDDELWETLAGYYDCKGFAPEGYLTAPIEPLKL